MSSTSSSFLRSKLSSSMSSSDLLLSESESDVSSSFSHSLKYKFVRFPKQSKSSDSKFKQCKLSMPHSMMVSVPVLVE